MLAETPRSFFLGARPDNAARAMERPNHGGHSRSASLHEAERRDSVKGAVEFLADKIHQLRLLADFLRDEPVKLQTAFVDEIVPHTEKDRRCAS